MKKSLIALAVVGAFSAPAFADPTFYGVLDGAVAALSNSGQQSQTLAVSGGLAESRLGLKGSEDVGDGMKVIYNLEYGLDLQTNSTIGTAAVGGHTARQQLLGLTGGFGTVATGYLQTTAYDFAVKFDPTANSLVSPVQNLTSGLNSQFLIGANAGASRAQRAVAYISPNMEGFTVAVNYATALAGIGNLTQPSGGPAVNNSATLVGAYYDQGPLSIGGVYTSVSSPAAATAFGSIADEREYALGASYDFGMAKLLGSYQATHNDGAGNIGNTDKLWSLSGVIPAGPGAAVLSYANAKIDQDTNGGHDGNSYTAAYLYGFSKTTTLYGAYSRVNNSTPNAGSPVGSLFSVANSAIAGGENFGASSNLFAIGLSKKF